MTDNDPAPVPGESAGSDQPLHQRLELIETAVAHLQHDLESLNESLTGLFRRLITMDERFTRIEHELETGGQSQQIPDPSDEIPPHY